MDLILLLLILLVLGPAAFLMYYVYSLDKIEKEPGSLLLKLFLFGALSTLVVIIPETISEAAIENFLKGIVNQELIVIILAFLGVGLVEEGAKFFFLKRLTWKDPSFNYRFDGIVYAVFVSLGFAAAENLLYFLQYGVGGAMARIFTAIPGHMGFAVFMGIYYSHAKICEVRGDSSGMKKNLWKALLVPMVLHGFYDSCALTGTGMSTVIFFIFLIAMYVIVIKRLKKESATDIPIFQSAGPAKLDVIDSVVVPDSAASASASKENAPAEKPDSSEKDDTLPKSF